MVPRYHVHIFVQNQGYRNSEFVLESGMLVDSRLITVGGRILETPKCSV